MRRYHPLSLLPIETLFLLSLPSASASSINYINYQPAVQIQVANSGPGANAGSSSGAGQGSSGGSSGSSGSTPSTPASVPFSPATPPICPASHVSCDTIGEPSWCCTDAQHCSFDEGGSIACCPTGNFCHGTVDYGSSAAGSSGGSGAGVSGSAGTTSGGDTAAAAAQQPDTASYGGNTVAGQSNGPVILTVSEGDKIANSTIAIWGVFLFLSLVVMV